MALGAVRLFQGVLWLALTVLIVANAGDLAIVREDGFFTTVSVGLLLACALTAFALMVRATTSREMLVWAAANIAGLCLAVDERYQIHEVVDVQVHRFLELQPTAVSDELDGMIVLLYVVVAAAFAWRFRAELLTQRLAGLFFSLAFALTAIMIGLDLVHTTLPFDNAYTEESAKLLAEGAFLCGFVECLRERSAW